MSYPPIKAGNLLIIETGDYSDFTFHGPFLVLRDFDRAAALALHRAQWKPGPNEKEAGPFHDSFIGWLVSQRYIELAENVVAWNIGYSELEDGPFRAITLGECSGPGA